MRSIHLRPATLPKIPQNPRAHSLKNQIVPKSQILSPDIGISSEVVNRRKKIPHQENNSSSRKENLDRIGMFDIVEVKRDIPNSPFKAGMRGHVVELYESPPQAAEVEIIEANDVRPVQLTDLKLIEKS